ncbi:MAG: aspartate/glutamate racemase family protein [Actinomycetia bacterium]|nr:aspartate/glutamate racemase family protein [Actinomycetes bacterium]
MNLRAITPIVLPERELARRQVRYDAIAPWNVSVHLDNLSKGPSRLETHVEVRESEDRVFEEAIQTDVSRYDGILLDCVLDPALERLRESVSVPVIGITHLVANYLGSLNLRMAAVARNSAIANELAERIHAFGWSSHLADVHVLNLSLEDIADTQLWNRTVTEQVGAVELQNVDVVINGCSAVEVRSADGPPLVDPTALALGLIGVGADLVVGRRT